MNIQLATETLSSVFGYDSFRPLQESIIKRVYEKKDALVLMPTGGGKSICYQIPALTMEGLGLVVSPLISLMKDQVEALRASGVRAAFLNSSIDEPEQRFVEDEVFNGNIDLLYVSPEKLVSQSFLPLLKRARVNLFAIDEAHCISAWGHDFRPEYTQLRFLKDQFPDVPVLALTATADKVTRRDIIAQLNMQDPEVFIASFDRPNLNLEVRPGQDRFAQIKRFIQERKGQSGIVYCLSRNSTEQIASKLNAAGIPAGYYHARMDARERDRVQEAFIRDELPVVCATVAFGMGIDKSNVRWVIHYNLPKNLESFYQEIGRAGRDGAKADTLLFYSYSDVAILRQILSENESDVLEVKLDKLERMQQYAEAPICRRKMLLNYFGEQYGKDGCGSCDVCHNPPEYFDGTTLAQMALSAVYRLKERVSMTILIDVLRGSGKKEVTSRGYHRIKTFGAGRQTSSLAWKEYIGQMIHLGLLEVAYDQHSALKLTQASREVLFEQIQVSLVRFVGKPTKAEKKTTRETSERLRVRDELFESLRSLRRTLAQQQGVPPYVIFNDATLEEMAATKPLNDEDFRAIQGVGDLKLKRYGDTFIQAIRQFSLEKSRQGSRVKGSTQLETLERLQEGMSIQEIAAERQMAEDTVVSHVIHWLEHGEVIQTDHLLEKEILQRIDEAVEDPAEPLKLGELYASLNEEIPYPALKLGLAILKNQHVSR